MPVIYAPSGMAKEYSPYACNLYIGCTHCCRYCYAPHTLQRTPREYFIITSILPPSGGAQIAMKTGCANPRDVVYLF